MSFVTYHILVLFLFFFFNDTATTEIYTLSLHDALPISFPVSDAVSDWPPAVRKVTWNDPVPELDRKSTRLNSSHANISYAVFCLKKKKNKKEVNIRKHILNTHIQKNTINRKRCNMRK